MPGLKKIKSGGVPELSAPAGDWPGLHTALDCGADSVYFGLKSLNMRNGASNFSYAELGKVVREVRKKRKKAYLALNSLILQDELKEAEKTLKRAAALGLDAVIAWDAAVVAMARKLEMPVHMSTQASVSNIETVRFYANLGVKRIVLARECSLEDINLIIKKIRNEMIDCEIETFVHGAQCVSVSGRCFMSQDMFAESANRGRCVQPCRREYLITDVEEEEKSYILGSDYILSARDLCTVKFIDRLIGAGIAAFKIEGRGRKPEYVREVTSVYRRAIDAYFEGALNGALKEELTERLKKVYNRGFSEGFYFGPPDDLGSPEGTSGRKKTYLGDVKNYYTRKSVVELAVRSGGLSEGDVILIYGKTTPASIAKVDSIEIEKKPVKTASRGRFAGVKIPFKARRGDKVYKLKEERTR
jgi:putative protease